MFVGEGGPAEGSPTGRREDGYTALKDAEADRDAADEENAGDSRRAKAREATESELKSQLKQAQDALAARSQPNAGTKALAARVVKIPFVRNGKSLLA